MPNHYEESQRKDLERIIRSQIKIKERCKGTLTKEQYNYINNYIIDLQNHYKDKYGLYYQIKPIEILEDRNI